MGRAGGQRESRSNAGGLREMLRHAAEVSGLFPPERSLFIRRFEQTPAARLSTGASAVSRQSRHARHARARAAAVAACYVLALKDEKYAELVLGAPFAALLPFNAEVCRKLEFLAGRVGTIGRAALERLFDRACRAVCEVAPRVGIADLPVLLRLPAALPALLLGPWVGGDAFALPVEQLAKRCLGSRKLDGPYLRMQLTALGSYAGDCRLQLDWLMNRRNRSLELAWALCFVRRDRAAGLYDAQAAVICGRPWSAARVLYPVHPASTVHHLVDHARSCLRSRLHFANPGMALRLLDWVDGAWRLGLELRAQSPPAGDERITISAFQRFERVQLMEKARFWSICERLRRPALRRRLEGLWSRNYVF